MSGVEAAGIVLAAIPLIISGVELYARGVSTSRRFRKYKQELERLLTELRTENTMFKNSITRLLTGVIRTQEMPAFLENPNGQQWKDADFDQNMRKRLGSSYESYLATIAQMIRTSQLFNDKLKFDSAGRPQFTDANSFKMYYDRLRFSLRKSEYDGMMADLRQANLSLDRMTTQILSLENTCSGTSKLSRRSLAKFKAIRDCARNFYTTLRAGWKCRCWPSHTVNLRLEPRINESQNADQILAMNMIPFHVLFCYDENSLGKPGKVPAPWLWEEAKVHLVQEQSSLEMVDDSDALAMPRGVRFVTGVDVDSLDSVSESEPDSQAVQDLCAAIGLLQDPGRDRCLSLLANGCAKQDYGLLIYPCKDIPPDRETWGILPLCSVLKDPGFTRDNRLRLAVTLASSVLQLHQTPWLEESWANDKVYFIQNADGVLYDNPFVCRDFKQQDVAVLAPRVTAMAGKIIRNQTLFALGVILIELWYGKPLIELRRPEDSPEGQEDAAMSVVTAWTTADRLVEELYSDAGAKYGDAVRRCVRCDFDKRSSNLEDAGFQRAVYDGVVAQLQENLDFLYQD